MGNQSKHKAIDNTYHQRIEELLYSKTNEKEVVSNLLVKIFADRRFEHALDVGAGPGEITKPLADMSKKLTIVELVPDYEKILRRKFPSADIIIDSIDNVSLKAEYDLILLSNVLYYFPRGEWLSLIEKLHKALLPNGELMVIIMNDSGDWWKVVNNYWHRLRKYIRFDYIPLSQFRKMLSATYSIRTFPFSFDVVFDSKDVLVDCIGRQILQINNEKILKAYHDDFAKFASDFKRADSKFTLHSDCEIVQL